MGESWIVPVENSSDNPRLDFFVKNFPDGPVLLVESNRSESVNHIIDRITSKEKIHVLKPRLVYCGRELQNQSIGICSIEENSLVYFVGGNYPTVWPAVDSIVETVYRAFRDKTGHAEINEKLNRFFECVPWLSHDARDEYLQILSISAIPAALVMLYSSGNETNKVYARDSICKFIRHCQDLPNTVHRHIIPMAFELCRLLKHIDSDNLLQWFCWNKLLSMLKWVESFPCKGMHTFIKKAIMTFFMEIAVELHTTISEEWKFSKMYDVLVSAIGKALDDGSVLRKEYLYALESISALCSCFSRCSKEKLENVLRMRKTALCNLIVEFSESGNNNLWLNDFKEFTDFRVRRDLAMKMLPRRNQFLLKDIRVDGSKILEESRKEILEASPESLQQGVAVEFLFQDGRGEGVTREWFQMISREIFIKSDVDDRDHDDDNKEPNSPFYVPEAAAKFGRRYTPYPGFREYDMFEFAGRVVGLALIHNVQLNVFFDPVFFLQMAGKEIGLEDISVTDSEVYKHLKSMLEGEISDNDITFEISVKRGETMCLEELCQGGSSMVVTMENVREYTELYVQHRFVKLIEKEVSLFAKGFSDLLVGSIPHTAFFQSLNPEDFDFMFGGDKIGIILEDWKAHTVYGWGFEASDAEWFWNIVEDMTMERKINLLRFWTAVRFLPYGGILGLPQKLLITRSHSEFPTSNSCYNKLNMPKYNTLEEMKTGLEIVSRYEQCIMFSLL